MTPPLPPSCGKLTHGLRRTRRFAFSRSGTAALQVAKDATIREKCPTLAHVATQDFLVSLNSPEAIFRFTVATRNISNPNRAAPGVRRETASSRVALWLAPAVLPGFEKLRGALPKAFRSAHRRSAPRPRNVFAKLIPLLF